MTYRNIHEHRPREQVTELQVKLSDAQKEIAELKLRLGEESGVPMQPIVEVDGVMRFQENPLVRYLLHSHPHVDLNSIAGLSEAKHRWQLAQLIGYSVSGGGGLDYADIQQRDIADRLAAELLEKDE